MPAPSPRLTPAAWEDLDALFDAVCDASGSAADAEAAYEGVLAAVEAAAPMPLAAPSVAARTGVPCDYRWVAHAGWLAFFHVEGGALVVDRVLWGRSRWGEALGIPWDGDE